MAKKEVTVVEYLKPCIGSKIVAMHEEADSLTIYLDDSQQIIITALADGGFNIDNQLENLH